MSHKRDVSVHRADLAFTSTGAGSASTSTRTAGQGAILAAALCLGVFSAGCAVSPDPAPEAPRGGLDFRELEMVQSWQLPDTVYAGSALAPDGSFAALVFKDWEADGPEFTRFTLGNEQAAVVRPQPPASVFAAPSAIAVSPDGQTLALSAPGELLFLAPATGTVQHRVAYRRGNALLAFNDMAFTPEGDVLVGINETLSWVLPTQEQFGQERKITSGLGRFLDTLSGNRVLAEMNEYVQLVDRGSDEPLCEFSDFVPGDVSASPNGELLVTTDLRDLQSGGFSVWRTADCEMVQEWQFEGYSSSMAWLADNTHFVAATREGKVNFWNALTGELAHSLQAHGSGVVAVDISADGSTLMTAALQDNKELKLWR